MIKTLIIEDEFHAREGLKKMLKIIAPSIQIINETAYVTEAVKLIKTLQPELVFMDIELEDGTSFDILNQLEDINFNIIFTTAYNQYAIKAFKYSAIDYLLKPINPSELKAAIERVHKHINYDNEYQELLKVLQNNIEHKNDTIVLKTTGERYIINLKDIIRLEADGSYTNFITINKTIVISKNLKKYQTLLGSDFVRVHQSHLINKKHVKSILKAGLLMSNDDTVPISTRKRVGIIDLIS